MTKAESWAIVAQYVRGADEGGAGDEQRPADREDPQTIARARPIGRGAPQLELPRAGAHDAQRIGMVEDRNVCPDGLRHTTTF